MHYAHDLPENTCPRPSASQYQTLVRLTRHLMVQVQTANGTHLPTREAAMYAVDGMAEAWELASQAESNLRAYFVAMTPVGADLRAHAELVAGLQAEG